MNRWKAAAIAASIAIPLGAQAAPVTVHLSNGATLEREKSPGQEPTRNTLHDRRGAHLISHVEAERLIAADRVSSQHMFGHLSPAFYDELSRANPRTRFSFIARAPFDDTNLPRRATPRSLRRLDGHQIDQGRIDRRAQLQEALENSPELNALQAQILSLGGRSRRASGGPFVYGDLSAEALLELAQSPQAVSIRASGTALTLELDDSTCALNVPAVQSMSITGSNLEVAIMEPGSADPGCFTVTATEDPFTSITSHATAVAGVVASTTLGFMGVSPGVNILNAQAFYDIDIDDSMNWVIANQGDVVNMSISASRSGQMTGVDELLDWTIRYDGITSVIAAGNIFNNNTNVTSPAVAFNVIAVGNHTHTNSCDPGEFTQSATSCFVDPSSVHGDRDKPEITAPGTGITSTAVNSCSATSTKSGTSLAAPHVAGIAALMMERDLALRNWPEAVKALLMTSGRSLPGLALIDDKSGAGSPDALSIDTSIQWGRWVGETWTGADFANNGDHVVASFNVLADTDRLRVALVWSTADEGNYPDGPSTDIDLYLERNGVEVATSKSWDNTFELVELINPAAGLYTIRAKLSGGWLQTDNTAFEYGAAAWTLDEAPCVHDGGDFDDDGVCGLVDNCPSIANTDQADGDDDGWGNVCDNCPVDSNADQADMDHDGVGDACDSDIDGDGCENATDEDPLDPTQRIGGWWSLTCNPDQGDWYAFAGVDTDNDGVLDCEDSDNDNDGSLDSVDPCPIDAGALTCLYYVDCPFTTPFFLCEIANCYEIFTSLDALINPDPTELFINSVLVDNQLFVQLAPGVAAAEVARLMTEGFSVTMVGEEQTFEIAFDQVELWGQFEGDTLIVEIDEGVAYITSSL